MADSRSILAVGLSLVALQGCPSSRRDPAPGPRPVTPSRATPDTGSPGVARIPEARARAALQAWLDAQNQGNFEAYGGLYAARFQGIKRAGPRTQSFDRAGWLGDRRRMFASAMRVEARDVSVESGADSVMVRFVQSFSTAGFQDSGPKQLVLVPEGGALRITREEMLRSDLLPPGAATATVIPPGGFLPVIFHGAFWVVLDPRPQERWATGLPSLISRGDVVVSRKDVLDTSLPAPLAALRGRTVSAFGERGQVCQARIAAFSMLHRVDVHFGTQQRWDGEGGSPRASDHDVAEEAWGMGDGGMVLAGRLEPTQGGCDGARWARASDLPAAPVFQREAASAALTQQVLTRFRALPAHRSLQESYERDPGAARGHPWDAHGGGAPRVWLWRDPNGGRQFVSAWSLIALGGCAEFRGNLWAVFEVQGQNLVLQTDPDDPGGYEPLAATDADGDGAVDFVVEQGVLRRRGTVLQLVEDLTFPNLDCDC